MEIVRFSHFTFTYPGASAPTLADVTLAVDAGQFVTLCGGSGSGKTTLLRCIKPTLAPHGAKTGEICFAGQPTDALTQRTDCTEIGFVMQEPDAQIVTDKVWHELAFGLENLGLPNAEIRARVAETAAFFGIEGWFDRDVSTLSGGQKQLLNLAAVMTMRPSLLLLDEPTSRLDPIAAERFFDALVRINRETGTAVILSEHRLDAAFAVSDRVILLDGGRVIADGTPTEIGDNLRAHPHPMALAMPAPMRVYAAAGGAPVCPVTVREGRDYLTARTAGIPLLPLPPEKAVSAGDSVLEMRDVYFRYGKDAPDVLRGLSLRVRAGEMLALVGGNGAGKSTALSLIAGENTPQSGKILRFGAHTRGYDARIAWLVQDVRALFMKQTVADDLFDFFDGKKMPDAEKRARVDRVIRLCGLEALRDRHPYDLSGGEMQRAALAKVLLAEPRLLLLDEPTKGLDAAFKAQLADILAKLRADGVAILMVTHDLDFCAAYADRVALVFDGAVASEGTPRAFFADKRFYTTAANRMARSICDGAVTVSDILAMLGGSEPQPPPNPKPEEPAPQTGTPAPPPTPAKAAPHRASARTVAVAALFLLLIPLTVLLGLHTLGDRKYMVVSLLVLVEGMLPFFLLFEGRRPQARELVLLGVLCALGVAGRIAFAPLPQVKPIAAVVILSGVALGGEAGFLIGAVTALVSNFYFGQGPWTPYQMFALGLLGFLAGLLFYRRRQPPRAVLCLYGFLSVLLVYGGIMNPAAVLMAQSAPTLSMFIAAYAAGLPMDLVHALSTVAFLFFAARPMLSRLDRVKQKYGLITA